MSLQSDEKNVNFFTEGPLQKQVGKQRLTDRYVFLLDSLIILTKKFNPQNARRSVTTGPVFEYKLKESYQIHKIDVIDRDDSEGRNYSQNSPKYRIDSIRINFQE